MPRKLRGEKYDVLRGRHRKRASAEVRDWDKRTAVPSRPSWMDETTWEALAKLRRELDPLQ
jgi:hypothetical protein